LATDGSITASRSIRKVLSHWLSWALPVAAVVLPLLCFIVVVFGQAYKFGLGEGNVALGRGDFLIPVLILCVDAMLRWFFDVKYSRRRMIAIGVVLCLLCFLVSLICGIAFIVVTSSPVTAASVKAEALITWTCFAVGGFAGLVAAVVSAPQTPEAAPAAQTPEAAPAPPGGS
jgi:uncharacterized membrane protein